MATNVNRGVRSEGATKGRQCRREFTISAGSCDSGAVSSLIPIYSIRALDGVERAPFPLRQRPLRGSATISLLISLLWLLSLLLLVTAVLCVNENNDFISNADASGASNKIGLPDFCNRRFYDDDRKSLKRNPRLKLAINHSANKLASASSETAISFLTRRSFPIIIKQLPQINWPTPLTSPLQINPDYAVKVFL